MRVSAVCANQIKSNKYAIYPQDDSVLSCLFSVSYFLQNSQQMYFCLYHTAKAFTNEIAHIRAITNIICLLALEFGEAEMIVEITGFVFGLQVIDNFSY